MTNPNPNKGGGAFNTPGMDAGPEQGGSNLGGLGATSATDRERDPEAEGFTEPATSSARDKAIADQDGADRVTADGGS
jgi:hypothetical protein